MDKKAILWPVVISVLIHITLLGIAGMIDLSEHIDPVDVLSVSIKDPAPAEKPAAKKEIRKQHRKIAVPDKSEKDDAFHDEEWREDTIDLGSADIKYVTYLARIKEKILRIWRYPQKAFENNEEGNVVVKMSIDADGSLAGVVLLSSSGAETLDEGALTVAREAAPYDPLPEIYNLSRLHVVASFEYKISD